MIGKMERKLRSFWNRLFKGASCSYLEKGELCEGYCLFLSKPLLCCECPYVDVCRYVCGAFDKRNRV